MNKPVFLQPYDQLQKLRDADPKNNRSALIQHFVHTRDRLRERYGFGITEQDWERLNWTVFCENDKTKMVTVKSDETSVYDVDFKPNLGRSRLIRVYFHEYLYCVTTAVPINDDYIPPAAWSNGLKARRDYRYEYGMMRAAEEERAMNLAPSGPFAALAELKPVLEPKKALIKGSALNPVTTAFGKPNKTLKLPDLVTKPEVPMTKPVLNLVPSAPAPKDEGMILRADNVAQIAKIIWACVEGKTYAAKGTVVKNFIEALKEEHLSHKADKMAPVDQDFIDTILGKTLRDTVAIKMMFLGIRLSANELLRLAEDTEHPMSAACAAFFERNRLEAVEVRTDQPGRQPKVWRQAA